MNQAELLTRLCAAFGPSGEESEIHTLLEHELGPCCDEISTDALGNLIAHKKGSGPKLMLSAHMDTVGLLVTHIEKEGFLRFTPLGGLECADLLRAPVRFRRGTVGVVGVREELEGKECKHSDLFLDIGASNDQEAAALVRAGDIAVYDSPLRLSGHCVMGPYLDNRVGCLVLLEVLKQLKTPENDLYFVFSVQEEVGLRGAGPAAWGIEPDYAMAVDVTCPDDLPGTVHSGTAAVGKGAAVKLMDHACLCTPALVKRLDKLAAELEIPHQADILSVGGTDAGPMQRTRAGALTCGVSVPCRYTHAPSELCDLRDVDACVRLITAFCERKLPER